MIVKYLELLLESMLKCYNIREEPINIIFERLAECYDLQDDESLHISKKTIGAASKGW